MEEKPIIKERTYSGTTENKENQKVQKFCFADIYKKDGASILLLLLLYVLQGIPLGLAASIPMLMQQKGVSYKEQALFSFVFWPFSLKLLWAPIVDGAFSSSFGRRKSWLIPVQFFLSIIMFWLSFVVEDLIEKGDVMKLTAAFFFLNFFAATQDIAVDGWALTMLSKENCSLASTCNSVGQTAGYFMGYVVFLALESASFCNSYLRTEPLETGVVTLPQFLIFWCIVFAITTTLLIFKEEEKDDDKIEGVTDTYKQLYTVCKLDIVKKWILIILTSKIAFSAVDSVATLKILDAGVPKEKLALLAVPMTPIQIVLPILMAPYTTGKQPLNLWLKSYMPRIFMGLVVTCFVYYTPTLIGEEGPGTYYFGALLSISLVHQLFIYAMFVSIMAFHAKIADPSIGGTYMTLLNTVCNLGGNWPATLALWGVEGLSGLGYGDGFYLESGVCAVFGIIWFTYLKPTLNELHNLDPKEWAVPKDPEKNE